MLRSINPPNQRISNYVLISISIVLFTIMVIRTAWYNDDAFIVFRTIDNFLSGYGLTWNVSERVESYSDPLFMLLQSFFIFLTGEFYYTGIFLSIAVSIISLCILGFKIAHSLVLALLGITILMLSKGFVEYSTSGLEDPMTHLLLALFFFVYFKDRKEANFKTLFFLSLIASFGSVNRLDTTIIFLPSLIYVFLKLPKLRGFFILVIGFIPLIIWKGFTFFYYGFPFPNTAYAKVLNTGADKIELIQKGVFYLENSLHWDPLTLVTILGAIIFVPFLSKKTNHIPIIIGIVLYLFFVIQMGGDYMGLRFLTAPLFLAVILISRVNLNPSKWKLVFPFFIVVIGLGSMLPFSPIWTDSQYDGGYTEMGIADTRSIFYKYTGLLRDPLINTVKHDVIYHPWMEQIENHKVAISGGVGFIGFFGGPELYIIDPIALGDPLLSKIPSPKNYDWRIGHFLRFLPPGYDDSIISSQNMIEDKNLSEYYDKLSIITKGELFDIERIKTIFRMNLGEYDHYLESYLQGPTYTTLSNFESKNIVAVTKLGILSQNIVFGDNGINVELGKKFHERKIEFDISQLGVYEIIYFNGDTEIGRQTFKTNESIDSKKDIDDIIKLELDSKPANAQNLMILDERIANKEIVKHILDVPVLVTESGYDNIRINSLKQDTIYMLKSINLNLW